MSANEKGINVLTQDNAIKKIVESVTKASPGEAPFALVLGSGFSSGLVPTVRELVTYSLPLWVNANYDFETFEQLRKCHDGQCTEIAREFWNTFVDCNSSCGLKLQIGENGLPEDLAEAYKSVFDPRYSGAVGEPSQARRFQRALMRLDQPRLNAAHFLLASILGVQPRKSGANPLFKARAAFSRLIITTNFDPFLQTALQAVNRLYVISDTPDLGFSDEILDDETDAIQLVYLHGSIHRRSQKATEAEIQAIKEKNARVLAPVLKRRGVIVLGYSGWDDAIVEAMAGCDFFNHRLYWCGRRQNPEAKGSFGPRVPEILRKHAAFYVPTVGAGDFMSKLCAQLVDGLPHLIANPVGQLKAMLECIDLDELKNIETGSQAAAFSAGNSARAAMAIRDAYQLTLKRLQQAEQVFLEKVMPTPRTDPVQAVIVAARLAETMNNYGEELKLCNHGLSLPKLNQPDESELLMLRGHANYFLGNTAAALSDFSRSIELDGAAVNVHADALTSRAVIWRTKTEADKGIADNTRVIDELSGADGFYIAKALLNRGTCWSEIDENQKALDDFNRFIDSFPLIPDFRTQAIVNRCVILNRMGDSDTALAELTKLIDSTPAEPTEELAHAFLVRGGLFHDKGQTDKALADYTHVIDASSMVSVEQVAQAYEARGKIRHRQGKFTKAIADYSRVIDSLKGVPIALLASVLYDRGHAFAQLGKSEEAERDYTRVIRLRGAPAETVAKALVNRANIWLSQQQLKKALADLTKVIEKFPNASDEAFMNALVTRSVIWMRKKEFDKALADTTRVIDDLPDTPVEIIAKSLILRGMVWRELGDADKAVADSMRAESLAQEPATSAE